MAFSKGQIITMNLDGTDREYRILKLNGDIAEVLCMSTVTKSKVGDKNTYAGGSLDTYLNSTWYNTLTAAAKAAIVSKTFNQDSWYWGTDGSPVYSGHYGTAVPGTGSYSVSKGSDTYGAQITRNVYALSVQDVIDYITDTTVGDGKLENYNIWKMFWNTTTQPSISENPWLRSAGAGSTSYVWDVAAEFGRISRNFADFGDAVRPAFTIDLSKILPPQLDAPQNVTASGTVVSFDPVTNATSYAVLADGNEIGTVQGAPQEYTDCITFTGETSDFTLAVGSNGAKEWDGTVEYSTDHTTWTTWNGTSISSVDKKLYLRGSGDTKFWTSNGAKFVLSARAACSGNIQTLLEYSNPPTSIPTSYCYANMFSGCTNLTAAPALPATTLAEGCYVCMFNGCTSLTAAPELPATTLASFCYGAMFDSCTSLTQAPELPATTLTTYCYQEMFRNCSSLVQAPALPATTLATTCYGAMFNGCASLTKAPELPATTLADYCYEGMFYKCTGLKISSTQSSEYPTAWRIPSSGTISYTPASWCSSMLSYTGGTFRSDPSINTTYYGAWTQTTPTLINFTIAGTSYQAEEGMTWEEWCNSSYNTGEYGVVGAGGGAPGWIGKSAFNAVSTTSDSNGAVLPSNVIENAYSYQLVDAGSGN